MDFYRGLDKLSIPFGFTGKIFLLAFIGTHIPLLSFCAFVALSSSSVSQVDWVPLILILIATLVGTALTLYFLYQVTTPVRVANAALAAFLKDGTVKDLAEPTRDEIGELFGNILKVFGLVTYGETGAHQTLKRIMAESGEEKAGPNVEPEDIAELLLFRRIGDDRETDFDSSEFETVGIAALTALDAKGVEPRRNSKTGGAGDAVSFSDSIHRASALLAGLARKRRIDLNVSLDAAAAFDCSARSARALGATLVLSAIELAGDGQLIQVRATETSAGLELTLANSAREMDEKSVEALSRALTHAGTISGMDANTRSAGIWVSMAGALAKTLGGTLGLRAIPGGGITLAVNLPRP